jgi:hypothetical protein
MVPNRLMDANGFEINTLPATVVRTHGVEPGEVFPRRR